MILMSLTVLICPLYAWSLRCHVSSASPLLCMVITMHGTHIIHRIHTPCMVLVVFEFVEFGGRHRSWGRRFCVPGGTKSLSTSTRCGVRRSAVCESAQAQQTPLKSHEETWAGPLRNQGPKIFWEVEIVPGCAVKVACPSCPDYSLEPPGTGRVIRNMLGWSKLEKTARSGVWLFRGALKGKNLHSSSCAVRDWVKKGSYRTAWAVTCESSCTCSYANGHGPAIGPHTGKRC